jgi:hypothetical protein
VLGYAYGLEGREADAQQVLDGLNAVSKQKYVPASSLAAIYVGLGNKDKACGLRREMSDERRLLDQV